MVARESDTKDEPNGAPNLFSTWRKALSRGVRAAAASLASTLRVMDRLARGDRSALAQPALLWAGLFCLLGGFAARVGFADGRRTAMTLASAAIASALWALVRYLTIIWVVAPSERKRRMITGAWAIGLTPLLFAVDGTAEVLTSLLSAYITYRALMLAGVGRRSALTSVTAAWGVQVAGMAILWLVMNVWVATLIG